MKIRSRKASDFFVQFMIGMMAASVAGMVRTIYPPVGKPHGLRYEVRRTWYISPDVDVGAGHVGTGTASEGRLRV